MKNAKDYFGIGTRKSYINDHGFKHVTDIPKEVAIEWVKSVVPDISLGSKESIAKELTLKNLDDYWQSRLWVIVGDEHFSWVAVNRTDDVFSVWTKKYA